MNGHCISVLRKYLIPFICIITLPLFTSFVLLNSKANALEILLNLEKQSQSIKSIEFSLLIKERIEGKYETHKGFFKIIYSPFKFYMKEEYPRNGLEVLYIEGLNNGKAWVHTNSFPWTTISLDPLSNAMRNGQHHSFYKTGYSYFIGVLDHLQSKYKADINNMLVYNGTVKYNNEVCHKITFTNPNFKYVYYTVNEGDNLEKLSYKLHVNDYMIKELNPDISRFDELEKDKKIKVPNDYGASFVLYIAEKTNLLIGIKVFDDKGLWEEYSYSGIRVNATFTSADFDINNPDYNF
jgi:outer membrane lipoprotein-sorting protein